MEIGTKSRKKQDLHNNFVNYNSSSSQIQPEESKSKLQSYIKNLVAPEYYGMLEYLLGYINEDLNKILIQSTLHYEANIFRYLNSSVDIPFVLSRHTIEQLQKLNELPKYISNSRNELIRKLLNFSDEPNLEEYRNFPIGGDERIGLLNSLKTDQKWSLMKEDRREEGLLEHLIVAMFMTYQPSKILQQVFQHSSDYYQTEIMRVRYNDAVELIPHLASMDVFVHQSSLYLANVVDNYCSSLD